MRLVERAQQAADPLAAPLGLDQLEVALRGGVELHHRATLGPLGWIQWRRLVALGCLQVAHDHAGGRLGSGQIAELRPGVGQVERLDRAGCRGHGRHIPAGQQRLGHGPVGRYQDFGRLQALKLGRRALDVELAGLELARGHVRPGQSQLTLAIAHQGDQIRGAVLGQQHRVGDRAGRERPDNGALTHTTGRLLLALLAHRHPVPATQQTR